MRHFLPLLLLILPGCPGPDMVVTPADSGPVQGDAGPLQDVGADAEPPQDSGVDAGQDASAAPDTALSDAGAPALEQYETSWAMWNWFEAAGRPDGAGGQAEAPHSDFGCTGGDDNLPVTCVSQASAEAFCLWRGQRLPTREEWLSDASRFPAVREIVSTTSAGATIHDGGCGLGVCDARGNVQELTSDGFAMGGDFDDAAPNLDEHLAMVDPHVGFRCRSL